MEVTGDTEARNGQMRRGVQQKREKGEKVKTKKRSHMRNIDRYIE